MFCLIFAFVSRWEIGRVSVCSGVGDDKPFLRRLLFINGFTMSIFPHLIFDKCESRLRAKCVFLLMIWAMFFVFVLFFRLDG